MNQIKTYIGLALLCALSLLAPITLIGCGSLPKRTYQTASATVITVDAAMTAWGHYVAQFHPPASEELKVKALYDHYHAAALVVADAGKAYSTGAGSSKDLNAALAIAAASLGDLVQLIESYGVNIQ